MQALLTMLTSLDPLQRALAALAGLSLLAVLVKPRWLHTLLRQAAHGCLELAGACRSVALRILAAKHTPQAPHILTDTGSLTDPAAPEDEEHQDQQQLSESQELHEQRLSPWLGATLLSQLIYGLLAAGLLLGMYLIDVERSGVVQFQSTGGGALPLPVSATVINGTLWALVLAYYGGICCEGLGWVGEHLHLFPRLAPGARRVLTIYAGIGVALSLIAMSLLYLVGQLKLFQTDWPAAVLVVSLLQGMLVNGASLPAVASLVLGVGAVVALLCAAGWLGATLIGRLVLLLSLLVEPRTPDHRTTDAYDTGAGDDTDGHEMSKAVYLVGVGPTASAFVAHGLYPAVVRYGGLAALGGWGVVDPARLHQALHRRRDRHDLSPLQFDIQRARMRGEHRTRGELVTERLLENVVDQAIARHQPAGLIVVTLDLAAVLPTSRALTALARLLDGHTLVAVVHLPLPAAMERREAEAARAELERLHERGVLACIIPLDSRSPSAGTGVAVGRRGQARYAAAALGQFIVAHLQDDEQLGVAEAMRQIGRHAPYCGLATTSATIPLGRQVWWWRVLRLDRRWGPRGWSDAGVVGNRARHLVDQLLGEQDSAALSCVNVPIDPRAAPLFVGVTVPLRQHTRGWRDLTDELEVALARRSPGATAIFVCGNGLPDRRSDTFYYAQASVWYPIAALPVPLPLEPSAEVDEPALGEPVQARQQPSLLPPTPMRVPAAAASYPPHAAMLGAGGTDARVTSRRRVAARVAVLGHSGRADEGNADPNVRGVPAEDGGAARTGRR